MTNNSRFTGSLVALVTPFNKGALDVSNLKALIEWHIEQGTHGIVVNGTTGECPTLSMDELEPLFQAAVRVAAGRVPIIAGVGANDTAKALAMINIAEAAGVDALLAVTPYYNRPNQRGLYQHYKTLHDSTQLPIIMYNVPQRTGVDMTVETVGALSELPRIIGNKDATADIARVIPQRSAARAGFLLLSGDDSTALAFNAHGGVGVISVTANVAPRLCADLQNACRRGDYASALRIQEKLTPLNRALFAEPSPAPTKFALSLLHRCLNEVRPPIFPIEEATQKHVIAALRYADLLT